MPTTAIAPSSAEKQEIVDNILDIIRSSNSEATVVLSYGLDDRDRIIGKYRAGTQVFEYEISGGSITDTPLSEDRNDSYLKGYYGDRYQLHDWIERFDAAKAKTAGAKAKKCTPGKSRECGQSCIPLKNASGEPRKCRFDPPTEVKQKIEDTTKKIKERQAKKGKTAEAKPGVAEKGGAIAVVAKTEEKAPKTKQQEIDQKYASDDPSNQDIENWMEETVNENARPDPEKLFKSALENQKKVNNVYEWTANEKLNKKYEAIKTKEQLAEAAYKEEQGIKKRLKERTGRNYYTLEDYHNEAGFDKRAEAIKKRIESSRTTPSGKEKAKKDLEKLEQERVRSRESAEAAVNTLNKNFSMPKSKRIEKFKAEFDRELEKRTAEAEKDYEKFKKGDKAAKEDIAQRIVRELPTYDLTSQDMRVNRREAVREWLKKVAKGGDEDNLGLGGKKPSAKELKEAYRKAAAKAHPDKGGSAEAFRKVNEAYTSLKEKYGYDSFDEIHELYADRSDSFWRGYYKRMAETQGLYVEV